MIDVDSFETILEVVRVCVRANRADLIEPALIDRQHPSAVMARIEAERTARPAAAPPAAASRSIFGDPGSEQAKALREATRRRIEAMYPGHVARHG